MIRYAGEETGKDNAPEAECQPPVYVQVNINNEIRASPFGFKKFLLSPEFTRTESFDLYLKKRQQRGKTDEELLFTTTSAEVVMPDISKLPIVNSLVDDVIASLPADIAAGAADHLRPLLTEKISKSLMEGEFYRKLSEEMLSGIQNIFKKINQVKETPAPGINRDETELLFNEASKQLDEILTTTERAASQILEAIERQQDLSPENARLIALAGERRLEQNEIERLKEINTNLEDDLMNILTELSFQDLTGQRIKKIIATLTQIESIAFELFVSAGLAMKAHVQNPDKDIRDIHSEAKQKASELKGPTLDSNQQDVDSLLAELGL
ncbi:MAG: protein phosphatase CheZ [Desulfovibrionaceae bacterium]|nr:protein phosphatase CheZ [Desulfovibrionaceae bacterium]